MGGCFIYLFIYFIVCLCSGRVRGTISILTGLNICFIPNLQWDLKQNTFSIGLGLPENMYREEKLLSFLSSNPERSAEDRIHLPDEVSDLYVSSSS